MEQYVPPMLLENVLTEAAGDYRERAHDRRGSPTTSCLGGSVTDQAFEKPNGGPRLSGRLLKK